jgi:hypothetical protein
VAGEVAVVDVSDVKVLRFTEDVTGEPEAA